MSPTIRHPLCSLPRLLGWLLLCALALPAAAEIIDDISVTTDANGEIDALIEFSVPVQYVRHFPTRRSDRVSIYFNVIGNVPGDQWLNYETHRTPPDGLVRGLTITTVECRDCGLVYHNPVIEDHDRSEMAVSHRQWHTGDAGLPPG